MQEAKCLVWYKNSNHKDTLETKGSDCWTLCLTWIAFGSAKTRKGISTGSSISRGTEVGDQQASPAWQEQRLVDGKEGN